jgi:hypothetical protein
MPILNASTEAHYEYDPTSVRSELLEETTLAVLWLSGTPSQ